MLISGLVFLMAVYILSIPTLGTEDISKALEWVFLVSMPNFDIGSALMDMYSNSLNKDTCAKLQKYCSGFPAEFTFGCCPGKQKWYLFNKNHTLLLLYKTSQVHTLSWKSCLSIIYLAQDQLCVS